MKPISILGCLLLSASMAAVSCFPATAQTASRSFVKDSIDRYVDSALKDWQIPGAAVCIVKDGQAVFMKGYGSTQMGGSEKVDENTLFMIGSNSKAFTASAMAMLSVEKKLSLDDK